MNDLLTISLPLDTAEPCKEGCLICTAGYPEDGSYRPHTFDADCWCTRNLSGKRILERCHMTAWIE